jgi:hypothetical protein
VVFLAATAIIPMSLGEQQAIWSFGQLQQTFCGVLSSFSGHFMCV